MGGFFSGFFSWGETTSQSGISHQGSEITVAQLSEQLQDLVDWQPFAYFLEGITRSDVDIIKHNNPLNVVNQRNALFSLWLRICPNPSWDHVITALDKAREFALALRIREYVAKCEHNQSQPQYTGLAPPLTVDHNTVRQLTQLKDRFHKLFSDFCRELTNKLQTGAISMNELILQLKIRTAIYNFNNIDSIKDISEYISIIYPHSTFLSYNLLIVLAEQFLDSNSEVLEGLRNHHDNIEALKQNVKIENLKNVLQFFIATKSVDETQIIVKAQKAWDKNELHAVEVLLETLFPFEHHKRLFRVEPGSVYIVYLVPHHIIGSLIKHIQHKKEFMRLAGIISLQVGETYVVQASKENEQFKFGMGLMEAVETRNNEAVKFLLQHALKENTKRLKEIDFRNKDGETPLFIASENGNLEVVKMLLQAKATPDTPVDDGATPLYIASENGDSEVVERLLQAKANPNIAKHNGATPLHIACHNGHLKVVERLLQAKANPNYLMNNGRSPLDVASLSGQNDVVRLLKHYY